LLRLVGASAVACSVAERAQADDAGGSAARTWDFGVRGQLGAGEYSRIKLCLLDRSDECPSDNRVFTMAGVEAYASFGRRTSGVRWRTSLGGVYGVGEQPTDGTLWGGRLLTGFEVLTAPSSDATLLFDLSSGLSFYAVRNPDESWPALAGSVGLGGRVDGVELLALLDWDTVLFNLTWGAFVSLGYSFR
jgi:hypothetical protein